MKDRPPGTDEQELCFFFPISVYPFVKAVSACDDAEENIARPIVCLSVPSTSSLRQMFRREKSSYGPSSIPKAKKIGKAMVGPISSENKQKEGMK